MSFSKQAKLFFTLILCIAAATVVVAEDRPLSLNLIESTEDFRNKLDADQTAVYAIVGDSISFKGDSYNWFLRDHFSATDGYAGEGYRGLAPGFSADPSMNKNTPGMDYRRSSVTWVKTAANPNNFADQYGNRAPDGVYSLIGGPGWLELDFYGTHSALHYIKEVGAGVLRLELNGVEIAQVDASKASGEPEIATFLVTTQHNDPWFLNTLRVTLVGASEQDPQWTQLNGLDMRNDGAGAVYHRIARGGAGPDVFLNLTAYMYEDTLQMLQPDLLVVMLDPAGQPGQQTYREDLEELTAFYNTVLPETEIVMATHHHFNDGNKLLNWTNIVYETALDRQYGFVNLYDLHADFSEFSQYGFLQDSVHLNAYGGSWYGRYMFSPLRYGLLERKVPRLCTELACY